MTDGISDNTELNEPRKVDEITEPVQEDQHQEFNEETHQARMAAVFTEFDRTCENEQINVAVSIVYDPVSSRPLFYCKGRLYDVTKLSVTASRMLKEKLMKELSL